MPVDELWYLADRASQRAEQAYHRLDRRYADFLEFEQHRSVSRRRFRELSERVNRSGAPFGAHTIVYRPSNEILLVRHDGVGLWVLPGGGVEDEESYRETAERELQEEAGIEAKYDGLAMLSRVTFSWEDHEAWGVLPVFAAVAEETTPSVDDPEGEITEARWFKDLPDDTRDRQWINRWRKRALRNA
ncbi:MAG: NUDIX hydrolase [Halodesulfurarchaeum sp.]